MITRNNYEEFFLLYIDNELSDAERETVERFVRDNPDLEAELDQFRQSVLRPGDDLFFTGKESLLRDSTLPQNERTSALLRGELPVWAGESLFIDEENYPTYLLSYLDNELDEDSRKIVEDHVRRHPRLEEELALLKQTRPEPDLSIVFAGKELLYKLQYSKRGIILSWSRIAAAVLLLITALLLFDKKTHRSREQSVSKGSFPNKKNVQKDQPSVTPVATDPLYNKKDSTALASGKMSPAKQDAETPKAVMSPENTDKNRQEVTRTGAVRAAADRTGGNRYDHPEPAGRRTLRNVLANNTSRNRRPDQMQDPDKNRMPDQNYTNIHRTISAPDLVSPAVQAVQTTNPPPLLRETAVSGTRDNSVVMAREGIPIEDPSAIRKNKMRGLFRKVTRILERTTSADNDNDKHGVLIGSFQVAL
ncbi:MAG: hypothetical protein P4L51_21885 [Puia sp.]|nr:hypothetical protein [Puia sp.]